MQFQFLHRYVCKEGARRHGDDDFLILWVDNGDIAETNEKEVAVFVVLGDDYVVGQILLDLKFGVEMLDYLFVFDLSEHCEQLQLLSTELVE